MDPLEPPPKACIIWMPAEDTSAIFLGPAPSGLSPDTDLQPTLDAASRIGDNDEDVLLYDLGNGQRVQIDRGTTAPIGKPLAAIIPLNREGFDETVFLTPLNETVAIGHTPAEGLLQRYYGPWLGDVRRLFDEYAF